MKYRSVVLLLGAAGSALSTACTSSPAADLVLVDGGVFANHKSRYYGSAESVPSFYLGRREVTQREWRAVMGTNPAHFQGDSLPVETVSWYDCVAYCNARSAREGLQPYYAIDKQPPTPAAPQDPDTIRWVVTPRAGANGYRLPTEREWEYAASGGQRSRGYTYSGSETIGPVAWFWQNSGDRFLTQSWSWSLLQQNRNRTRPAGAKAPNELGLYDMSGNVREWCEDWQDRQGPEGFPGRIWKGGGWIGADFCCAPAFRASYEASGRGADQGFRVCRNR